MWGRWPRLVGAGPPTAGRRGKGPEKEVGRLGDARYDLRCHPQFPRRKIDAWGTRHAPNRGCELTARPNRGCDASGPPQTGGKPGATPERDEAGTRAQWQVERSKPAALKPKAAVLAFCLLTKGAPPGPPSTNREPGPRSFRARYFSAMMPVRDQYFPRCHVERCRKRRPGEARRSGPSRRH